MAEPFPIRVDRSAKLPLGSQIHAAIRAAIEEGRLAAGARLPSWRDLAAQLGVARGTVRVAYERLIDEQLVVGQGAAGTRVALGRSSAPLADPLLDQAPLPELYPNFGSQPLPFQMGVPAQDAFPFKLWSRVMARCARQTAAVPVSYPDPRGSPELRREIAGYLAISRGIRCTPGQILVTGGFAGGLGLTITALGLSGGKAWHEDPGFPLTRKALRIGGLQVVGVPVDAEGIDVAEGDRRAPDATVAVVTPGQQAPLGVTLSLRRRLALLAWAQTRGAWIVEDDYLSELQLTGRAAPALASLDQEGRVIHIGSFSKTISPALRLGFLVVPPALIGRFGDAAACLAPAPAAAVQMAVASFIAEGHYLRHLRRMKRLYAGRREALIATLGRLGGPFEIQTLAGLAVRLGLQDETDDVAVASNALALGLAPVPLSPWYAAEPRPRGLLLGVTNLLEGRLKADCKALIDLRGLAR